jgi:threonine/homoserine/homoserine lactone efflux protein
MLALQTALAFFGVSLLLGITPGPDNIFVLAQLGATFILATLVTFATVSYFAATLGQRLRGSARAQQWMNGAAGAVFAGLALRLAAAQR